MASNFRLSPVERLNASHLTQTAAIDLIAKVGLTMLLTCASALPLMAQSVTPIQGGHKLPGAAQKLQQPKIEKLIVKFKSGITLAGNGNVQSSAGVDLESLKALQKVLSSKTVKHCEKSLKIPQLNLGMPEASRMLKKKFAQRAKRQSATTAPQTDFNSIVSVILSDKSKTEETINNLKENQLVEFVQPSYQYRAIDPVSPQNGSPETAAAPSPSLDSELWGMKAIKVKNAWNISKGAGVTVAVVDTGVNRTHQELKNRMWSNTREIPENCIDDDGNGFIDDVNGWSFADENADEYYTEKRFESCANGVYAYNETMDFAQHGSHVAGTIAAENDGQGIYGVAPESKIMAVKGLNDWGFGDTESLAKAIIYATLNGADVINNSWGGSSDYREHAQDRVLKEAIQFAVSNGVVVVFAAGNEASNIDGLMAGNYVPEVITVGAVGLPDSGWVRPQPNLVTPQNLQSAYFSNYGLGVDVVAPGVEILSSIAYQCDGSSDPDQSAVSPCPIQENSDLAVFSGTSMSAPHVSGVAALILSTRPSLKPLQVRSIIKASASPTDRTGPDPFFAAGLVNAQAAVSMAKSSIRPPIVSITSPVSGEEHDLFLKSSASLIDLKGIVNTLKVYSVSLYRYDDLFKDDKNPQPIWSQGKIELRQGSDTVPALISKVALNNLSSGRYALSISNSIPFNNTSLNRQPKVSETVPFAVLSKDVRLMSTYPETGDAICLNSNGNWVTWLEYPVPSSFLDEVARSIIEVKAYNTQSAETKTIFSFSGSEGEGEEYREVTTSCPQVLSDGSAVWFLNRLKLSDPFAPLESTLFRAQLSTSKVEAADVSNHGAAANTWTTGGMMPYGKELYYYSTISHLIDIGMRDDFGNVLYAAEIETLLNKLPANSVVPQEVQRFKNYGDIVFLTGSVNENQILVAGDNYSYVQQPDGPPQYQSHPFVLSYGPDGSATTPQWFTPQFSEYFGAIEWSNTSGRLIGMMNQLSPETIAPGYASPIPFGFSLFDLKSGRAKQLDPSFATAGSINGSLVAWMSWRTRAQFPVMPMYSINTGSNLTFSPGFVQPYQFAAARNGVVWEEHGFKGKRLLFAPATNVTGIGVRWP